MSWTFLHIFLHISRVLKYSYVTWLSIFSFIITLHDDVMIIQDNPGYPDPALSLKPPFCITRPNICFLGATYESRTLGTRRICICITFILYSFNFITSADEDIDSKFPTNIIVYSSGDTSWIPLGLYISSCAVDIKVVPRSWNQGWPPSSLLTPFYDQPDVISFSSKPYPLLIHKHGTFRIPYILGNLSTPISWTFYSFFFQFTFLVSL